VKSLSRREFLAIAAGVGGAAAVSGAGWLIASSASDEENADDGGVSIGSGDGTAEPTATAETTATAEATAVPPTETATEAPTEIPTAEPTQPPPVPGEPSGYAYPLSGVHIPDKSSQLPNAARDYRCGVHEGVDFYPFDSGPYIGRGDPVYAARAGTVIRVDHEFTEYTTAEREADLSTICATGGADAEILDRLRGRQVWIEHDDGNTSRYCHLNNVEGSLSSGQTVSTGQVIAGVGNSGTSNGAAGTELDIHLHFELRLGDPYGQYLGAGQPESEVRRLLGQLFS
jgi:murein DD-endopeptidase MepM/ murein hydrolase activator NlpD